MHPEICFEEVKNMVNKRGVRKTGIFVLILLCVLFLGFGIFYFIVPMRHFNIDAAKITSVFVLDGTNGKALTISDPGEIEIIVSYLNAMELKPTKVSVGYMGYRFHISLAPGTGTWSDFILNNPSLVRNDPFFYELESDTGLYDYLEALYEKYYTREEADNELPDLLKGQSTITFISEHDASEGSIADLNADAYTVIDLDEDGEDEVVLRYADYMGFCVLRFYEDKVYGYEFPYRGLTGLKQDGTFGFSNASDDNGVGRLSFDKKECITEELMHEYPASSYNAEPVYDINGQTVDAEEYERAIEKQLTKTDVSWFELNRIYYRNDR